MKLVLARVGLASQKDNGTWKLIHKEVFYMIKMVPRIEIGNSEYDILYNSSECHILYVK